MLPFLRVIIDSVLQFCGLLGDKPVTPSILNFLVYNTRKIIHRQLGQLVGLLYFMYRVFAFARISLETAYEACINLTFWCSSQQSWRSSPVL